MLDTVVPSIAHDICKLATDIQAMNPLLHTFLPLTRREELLEYEQDLRVRQTTAWRYIVDWILDGVQNFLTQAIRLLDVIESRHTSRKNMVELVNAVHNQAVIIGDRCLCGRNQTQDISRIHEQFGGVLQLYADNPIPRVDLESSSWVGYAVGVMAGPPPHSSPEVFRRLISLNDQMRIGSEQINGALDNLTEFFGKLTRQFNPDKLDANWAAKLDLRALRQRWSRLQDGIVQGKQDVAKAEQITSNLPEPLFF
ncbi:hypothetical protein FRB94_013648 [Tulasnella sp. JGI-2019a]|nr:hypothetical protein FRB94_013648 [Tulasnella sp. JGI-2019a]KAG9010539.1 hypothetical protein FRB93_003807 [Tulasnella sp. JGI-2019a]